MMGIGAAMNEQPSSEHHGQPEDAQCPYQHHKMSASICRPGQCMCACQMCMRRKCVVVYPGPVSTIQQVIHLVGGPLDGAHEAVPQGTLHYQRSTFTGYYQYNRTDRQTSQGHTIFEYEGKVKL
jgi:hypothetical protein